MFKIIAQGNLARDPEPATSSGGKPLCRLRLVTNEPDHNSPGGRKTQYFYCTVWGRDVDLCLRVLKKGQNITVVGDGNAREFVGNDGQTHVSMQISVDTIGFGGKQVYSTGDDSSPDAAFGYGTGGSMDTYQNATSNGYIPVADEEPPF